MYTFVKTNKKPVAETTGKTFTNRRRRHKLTNMTKVAILQEQLRMLNEAQSDLIRFRMMDIEADIARDAPQFRATTARTDSKTYTSYWGAEQEARERNHSIFQ